MKKILCVCVAILIVMGGLTATAAGNDIAVIVNGRAVQFDQPPIIENGRTLVPMRAIFEALGCEVDWKSYMVDVYKDDAKCMTLWINSTEMVVNRGGGEWESIYLDVAPKLVSNRTLVPVRAISESIGADVEWNSGTQTVIITLSERKSQNTQLCRHDDTTDYIIDESSQRYNDSYHKTTYEYEVTCDNCGKVIKTYLDSELDEHRFKNGVCTVCGYEEEEDECPHKNTRYVYNADKGWEQNGSDKNHTVIEIKYEYCDDCGEQIDEIVSRTSEAHSFDDNGVCELCGYKGKEPVRNPGSGGLDVDDDGNFKTVTLQSGESFVVTNRTDKNFSVQVQLDKNEKYHYVSYDKSGNASCHYDSTSSSTNVRANGSLAIYNRNSTPIEVKGPSSTFYPEDEAAFNVKQLVSGQSCRVDNDTEKNFSIYVGIGDGEKRKYDYVSYDKSGNAGTHYKSSSKDLNVRAGGSVSVSNSGDSTLYIFAPARVTDIR